ncbi:MAG: NUDIX hydrolase [Thermofilaceae archaeon]
MEPRVLGDELLAVGKRLKLLRRRVEAGGVVFERDVVAFGEAVIVVPILGGGKVLMVKQWRAPIQSWVLEVPAGKLEQGEDPREAAVRELEEETGYIAGSLVELGSFYATPGYSDEVMHFYAALQLSKGRAHPEPGEVLKVVEVDADEYLYGAGSTPRDLKTVASLLLCKARGLL